jgi:hypothetical protein
MAAGYGRAFSFSGSLGVELFEPLSFKGRMGSGVAGGRNAYADKSLDPKYDWQKFEYQYRVWGRLATTRKQTPTGGGAICAWSFRTPRRQPKPLLPMPAAFCP